MRALRNTPQPPTAPMDGRLPNKFGNSSAPVFNLHVRGVCGLSLIDAVRISEQVLMRTALAPLFHQPSAIVALRHGFKRGPLPRPADMLSILSGHANSGRQTPSHARAT